MGRSEHEPLPAPPQPDHVLMREADRLKELELHLWEAATCVTIDRQDVADYLMAVRHGVRLGELRIRGLASRGTYRPRNQGIA